MTKIEGWKIDTCVVEKRGKLVQKVFARKKGRRTIVGFCKLGELTYYVLNDFYSKIRKRNAKDNK